jgi:hypothetical protein
MAYETGTASDHDDLFTKLRTFLKAGANAEQTLTLTANAGNTETVTIGAKTYTFQTVLTNTDGNVFIGATMSDTLNNLRAAINLDPAVAGTLYAAATVVHPTARAVRGAGNTLVARAKTAGTGGNSLATTETLANGSWGAATMAGGGTNAWTERQYSAGPPQSMLLKAPGLSGLEDIGIGFSYEASVGTDSYALTGWMHRSYNSGLGQQSQPGHSGLGYHPVWNQPMPYWFIANRQRVIIITKVSTVYTASYLGKFLMYGTPGEYPQPYARLMPFQSNQRWSSTSETVRNFFDPGAHTGSHFLHTSGVWYQVANFVQSTGESGQDGTNYIWPFRAQMVGGLQVTTRYRELRDNVDNNSYTLWPLVLCGENPAVDIYGELDGAFACPGFDAGSEDFITQNNEDHVLVQNVFRTTRYYYAAVQVK